MSKSFAITVRPRSGITDGQVVKVHKWLMKKSVYFHIITEKLDLERHVHAVMILEKESTKGNVGRSLCSLFPDLDNGEKLVLKQGVKIAFNTGWLDYMNKPDNNTVVIGSNLPEKHMLESYFPVKKENESKEKPRKNLSYYGRLEKLWFEHQPSDKAPPVTALDCRHFLCDMMYNKRLIDVVRDDRTIFQVSRHLSRFVNKQATWPHEDTEYPFEKPDG